MRLTLKIVGGFTGPAGPEVHEIDLDHLPPKHARRLQRLVDASHFFELPATMKKSAPASWDFLHEITVHDAKREHTVRFHPEAASPEVRALSEAIAELAKE